MSPATYLSPGWMDKLKRVSNESVSHFCFRLLLFLLLIYLLLFQLHLLHLRLLICLASQAVTLSSLLILLSLSLLSSLVLPSFFSLPSSPLSAVRPMKCKFCQRNACTRTKKEDTPPLFRPFPFSSIPPSVRSFLHLGQICRPEKRGQKGRRASSAVMVKYMKRTEGGKEEVTLFRPTRRHFRDRNGHGEL